MGIIEVENQIFDEYGQDLGVSSMREYEESKLKLIEERAAKKKELNAELTEIENKLKFLSRKNEMNTDQIEGIESRLEKVKADIVELGSKRLKKLQKEIANE